MTSRGHHASDAADAAQQSLFSPVQLNRWQGLPLGCFSTPPGAWSGRFAAPTTSLAVLDTGAMRTRFQIGGRSHDMDIRPGGFGLFGAGVEVGVVQIGALDARRILLEVDSQALVRRGFCDDDRAWALHPNPFFDDPALVHMLRLMVDEVRQGCPNGALFAESLSLGAVLHVRRTRAIKSAGARERGKLSARQWARLDELIDQALACDLSLATLSAALGLSKPHFVRLLRNTTGTSPHRYVMRKRAERALHLIQCSNLPLAEIASEAGFANQGHFNRVFHSAYGLTPGDARRQARIGGALRIVSTTGASFELGVKN